MKSFDDVRRTQRETAAVIAVSLSFVFIFIAARVLPNVVKKGLYLHPLFYVGIVSFGLIGFLAFEILGAISFLGDGAKVGTGVFIALILVGAWTGGEFTVAFLSGSIMGVFLFYAKSIYAMYRVLSIETQAEELILSFTELEPQGSLKHYMIEGIGSNFEMLSHFIEDLKGDGDVMFYARYNPPEYKRLDAVLNETMRFYANHMMPLHQVKSRKSSQVIKQICFECSSREVMEKGLINYWLRAHLTGGYTCIIVPYKENFIEKAAACESSIDDVLNIEDIIGQSPWLLKTDSLTGNHDNFHDFYTIWDKETLSKKISMMHQID
jgi:hypothetical protein